MTDILTADTLAQAREASILMSSDNTVDAELAQVEKYIAQNKGTIMKCLSGLPGPMLTTVRSIVKIFVLTPLKYLLALPLTKISKALEDFTKNECVCPPPPPPSNDDNCPPT